MRAWLNKNPIAQVGLVLVLVALAYVMLSKSGGGGSSAEEPAPTEATVSVAGTSATGTATGATPGEAVEGAVEEAVEGAASEAESAPVAIPTPPLPAPVAAAYDAGKTVVLLIVHDGGIDDRLVADSTRRLGAFPDTAVFIVPAKQIARYGAITIGVDVQQVPALVAMRPRGLSEGVPQASVSYGFQTEQGIEQAMRDASYNGPEATYHPN